MKRRPARETLDYYATASRSEFEAAESTTLVVPTGFDRDYTLTAERILEAAPTQPRTLPSHFWFQ